ncbi:MAG: CBS domain-containing protein [Rhodospirillaceae bacterium]|jgi:CBS domain-containing protein
MSIRHILYRKGNNVITVASDAFVREAAEELVRNKIGAVVVTQDGHEVAGILSERDVVRTIVEYGEGILDAKVHKIMTVNVESCRMDDTADWVLEHMTKRRIRHLPVVEDGRLAGMISIGDVVKFSLDNLNKEARAMREYIAS